MLLKCPPPITSQELEQLQDANLSMRWVHPQGMLEVYYTKGKTRFNLHLNPENLALAELQNQFTETITHQGNKQLTYRYKHIEIVQQDVSAMLDCIPTDAPLVYQANPLVANNTETIAALIQDKHIVFYTGAGISASAVFVMDELMNLLQLNMLKNREAANPWHALAKIILNDPKAYIAPMKQFFNDCVNAKPTPAHEAITNMVIHKNWGLLTENVDFLHEGTGIRPLKCSTAHWLHDNVTPDDLQKIDYVITVGLGTDESSFLNWYRRCNKKGTIIALNLVQPNYLGPQDIFLAGDAQLLLPQLWNELGT